MMRTHKVVYASGNKGASVRADGEGGVLTKGWYVFKARGGRFGPFRTERMADTFAGND